MDEVRFLINFKRTMCPTYLYHCLTCFTEKYCGMYIFYQINAINPQGCSLQFSSCYLEPNHLIH